MNIQLIEDIVETVAKEHPGVYSLVYENGNKGTEFADETLYHFSTALIEDVINTIKPSPEVEAIIRNRYDL